MADTTWYAWSAIDYGAKHDSNDKRLITSRKVIPVGAEVSPSDLSLDEDSDAWKELVQGGSVRDYLLPEDLRDANTSPQKIVSARIAAMQEGVDTGELNAEVVSGLMSKKKYPLEGDNEISPDGEVSTPQGGPPPPQSSSGIPS